MNGHLSPRRHLCTGLESPKIESLKLASQTNGSAEKATSTQAAKPEAEPPSAPDDDPDDDEDQDQEKEEELKVIHEELAKEDSRYGPLEGMHVCHTSC